MSKTPRISDFDFTSSWFLFEFWQCKSEVFIFSSIEHLSRKITATLSFLLFLFVLFFVKVYAPPTDKDTMSRDLGLKP